MNSPTGDIADILRKFKLLIQKGDVNAALKLLMNYMNNGILPLKDDTNTFGLKTSRHKTGSWRDIKRPTVKKNSSHFYNIKDKLFVYLINILYWTFKVVLDPKKSGEN